MARARAGCRVARGRLPATRRPALLRRPRSPSTPPGGAGLSGPGGDAAGSAGPRHAEAGRVGRRAPEISTKFVGGDVPVIDFRTSRERFGWRLLSCFLEGSI